MSTHTRPHINGLAASGLLWLATSVADAQVPPAPPGPAPIPAPASTPSSTFQVLLMSNGTVVRGEIAEDPQAGVYRLKCKGGQVPYPKTSVRKVAGSVEELYRYQVDRLPPHDPDERLKLVRWCLTEHLVAQAREQLAAVLALCPGDPEAKMMARNMDANAEAATRLDPEIQRTGGEMPGVEAPAALDSRIVKDLRRAYGNKALPEIFDLPPAVAVARANDFARTVHPVLQQNCAGCHNERYQGEFQLVQIKIAKDLRNPDVARANLDATLRLVNPDDPTRSDLLSNGLVPHGSKKNAIFKGPNDPQYQILSAWARSLRPAPSRNGREGVTRTGYSPADSPDAGGFGSDRPGRQPSPVIGSAPRRPVAEAEAAFGSARPGAPRPSRPDSSMMVSDPNNPAPPGLSFPLPFSAGGDLPSLPETPRRPGSNPGKNEATGEPGTTPPVVPTTATPIDAKTVVVESTEDPNQLPGMNQPRYPTLPKAGKGEKAKPKLDPALLEKLMKNRNAQP